MAPIIAAERTTATGQARPGASEGSLSEIARRALVALWGRYVRGEEQPPVIDATAEEDAIIDALEEQKGKFDAGSRWFLRLSLVCARLHPSQSVIWFETPAGPAIIASGDEEVDLFRQHFRSEMATRAHERPPCPIEVSDA